MQTDRKTPPTPTAPPARRARRARLAAAWLAAATLLLPARASALYLYEIVEEVLCSLTGYESPRERRERVASEREDRQRRWDALPASPEECRQRLSDVPAPRSVESYGSGADPVFRWVETARQAAREAKERCDQAAYLHWLSVLRRLEAFLDSLAGLAEAEAQAAREMLNEGLEVGRWRAGGPFFEVCNGAYDELTERATAYRFHLSSVASAIRFVEDYPYSEPCPGQPDDANPNADLFAECRALLTRQTPERGEKTKDQLDIRSTSGRPIPGGSVTLVELPGVRDGRDDPFDDDSQIADDGPDDDTQEEADTVVREKTYVVKAPCHEELVVSGDRLWAGDVDLQPKGGRRVLWNTDIDEEFRDPDGESIEEEVRREARNQLADLHGLNIDDFEVEIVRLDLRGTAYEMIIGGIVYKVVLTPKRAPCPDALPRRDDDPFEDDYEWGTRPEKRWETLPEDDSEAFETLPKPLSDDSSVPAGDDDPSVDPPVVVPPPDGTLEETREREDKRPPGPASDPFFDAVGSWGQDYADQWGLRRIGFEPGGPGAAALRPRAAEPVLVAVVDTGIDRFHPELRGAVWVNEDEVPGNGVDDDGNGYVDDVHGWNFADDSNDTLDINGHGTVTAGIIAAATGNGRGIAGVNPWARILPVRITTWSGRSTNFRLADAIRYAVDAGARIINLSYGGLGRSWDEYLAVSYARANGVIVVAAAGNDGAPAERESPAGLPGVITVAATDVDDTRLGFSNWGPGIDIAAPGVDILSLRARHTDLLRFKRDDYEPGAVVVGNDRRYYRLTGTSFSAPFVAGVASLVWSVEPELDDMQVMRKLLHSARDIGTEGWDQYTGYGRLDARAALAADPDRYLLARLSGVVPRAASGGTVIEVSGRARADRFGRAWIEMRPADDDGPWVRATEDLRRPVDRGVLGAIPASRLRGARVWILRLVVEHADGSRREARFELTLG